jgi:hypothetical protein
MLAVPTTAAAIVVLIDILVSLGLALALQGR